MIRVLVVDDHPAMQAGLTAVLRTEPGFVPVGAVETEFELWPALTRTRPDVVLLDYHLPPSDGLALCRRIKRTLPPPAVLLFSAYADANLAIAARLAGADGLVNKGAAATELHDAIRTVAKGRPVMPAVDRELLAAAGERLPDEDLPILGMALDGTPHSEIAQTLRLDGEELGARLDRMIERLKVEVPNGETSGR
ncbi:MAG TPA: response regulator transcription factor [Solirubrobacteraceae bacterium]|nr:response regulator transcription factor [Solirubrobacteraceae bacterium]